jgi:transposase
MNVLDKHGLKGYYIIDNVLVYRIVSVREFIEERGYKYAYLSPYSPFLNPMEEF